MEADAVIELWVSFRPVVVCAILNPNHSRRVKSFCDCWSRFTPTTHNPSILPLFCLHSSYDDWWWRTTSDGMKAQSRTTSIIKSQSDQRWWRVSVRWSLVMILIFANNYNCTNIRIIRSLNFLRYLQPGSLWFSQCTLPLEMSPRDGRSLLARFLDCNLWTILCLAFYFHNMRTNV